MEADLVAKLDVLGRRSGATLFMVLAAGFKVLLWRYSGQRDLVLGVPVANRGRRELEGLIGFFVNTLVLRTALAPRKPFIAFLDQVRERTLEAFAHQDLPFNLLVEELCSERAGLETPLFNVIFALQNVPRSDLALPGVVLEEVPVERQNVRFDLGLALEEAGGALEARVEYDGTLFAAGTVERLFGHYRRLLEGFAEDPGRPVGSYPLEDEAVVRQLLSEWNPAATSYPAGRTIPSVFAMYALAVPERVAVVCGAAALTYGELEHRAGMLASGLLAEGLGQERPVAVCLTRSNEMVVALLAVLRAGGYYVGVDPQAPAARIARVFESSGVELVLIHEEWNLPLPQRQMTVLFVGQAVTRGAQPDARLTPSESAGAACPTQKPPHPNPLPQRGEGDEVSPLQLAYVSYTSGSTGVPKGVAITHRGVLRLVCGIRYLEMNARETVLQVASLAFDASTFEVWGPLLNGGRLIMAPRTPSLVELGHIVRRYKVTTLHLTPDLFKLMVEHQLEDLAGLRQLPTGGDAASPSHFRRALEALTGCVIFNCYGPTESTMLASVCRVTGELARRSSVPIGRPIDNTRVVLVDELLNVVPAGVPGQLTISGPGLARGYVDDPVLSASRFVPEVPSGQPGERLYLSGDRARWSENGLIEFLGRLDEQVKIRGFRVEPAEIEHLLADHRNVGEALVLVGPTEPGENNLLAFALHHGEPVAEEASEQVRQWQTFFDQDVYDNRGCDDPTLNLSGWVSSYDGSAIPRAEMIEWLDDAVAKVRALAPRRILELGCGTGMFLFRLAPSCEHYTGLDVSARALGHVRNHLDRPELANVEVDLREGAAHELGELPDGAYDLVLLNSVVQYFPSADYLEQVIESALAKLGERGVIFFGDVRDLRLQEHLAADVVTSQAAVEPTGEELRRAVRERTDQETELLLDPEWFFRLAERHPAVSHVEALLKQATAPNELNRFRYDVRVYCGTVDLLTVEWHEPEDLDEIRRRLRERPAALAFRDVPNARLSRQEALVVRLRGGIHDAVQAIDPRELWDLGCEAGYETRIRPAGEAARFDVVFLREASAQPVEDPRRPAAGSKTLSNSPLRSVWRREVAARLREHLAFHLPEYMMPAHLEVLDAWPRTSGGKVDRGQLVRRAQESPRSRHNSYEDESTSGTVTESLLAATFSKVLGMGRIGVEESFFELGGHSLLATRVISQVREVFGVEISLETFFRSPTAGGLATAIETARRGGLEAAPLEALPRPDRLPLSYAQQRLWFLDRLDRGNPFYNVAAALRLEGALDAGALEACLATVVRRHESLRTVLRDREGEPYQVVLPELEVRLPVEDVSLGEEEHDLAERLAEQVRRRFDLEKGPLWHACLLRLGKAEHVFVMNLHHVVTDGWSVGVLVREMATLYEAVARRSEEPDRVLPELEVQYADYAIWQRGWLDGAALEHQVGFWQRHLEGAPALLELPADRLRPALPSFCGEVLRFRISAGLTGKLRALCLHEGATLSMLLHAVFAVLLSRHSYQSDVVLGVPVANRRHRALEPLIGFFVNTLPMRLDLGGEPALDELLGRMRRVALDAYAHQDVPFEQLVEALRPERDLAFNPIFQVLFALQNAPLGEIALAGLTLTPIETSSFTAKFDLSLSLEEVGVGVAGTFELATDLFDTATIRRWSSHYLNLLETSAARPEAPLGRLSVLGEEERRQLEAWSGTGAKRDDLRAVHEMAEERALVQPDRIALVFDGRCRSYGELHLQVQGLARWLRQRGVAPEVVVGVSLPRSFELIISVWAVLEAGGTVLPLDPGLPEERRSFMIEDSGAVLVLDSSTPKPEVSLGAPRVGAGESPLPHPVYVIYTSGSTGRAKGVVLPHSVLANLVAWQLKTIRGAVRTLQFTSLSFDVAFQEIFSTLAGGGALVLVDEGERADADALARRLERERVERLFQPFVALQSLAEAVDAGSPVPDALRDVITAGEALRATPALRALFRRLGHTGLYNHYGPSEAHAATSYALAASVEQWPDLPPIGRPIVGAEIHIADRRLVLVPVAVSGELLIGRALARGYLRQPGLTAEKFVPDPLSRRAGARLYRTGDLARWSVGGELEYLGRADHQVKVRGFRVELGEIEAVLAGRPDVSDVAIVLRGEPTKQLIAYLTTSATADELREFLARRLPDYMVPSYFVAMESFPLTTSGKIDRKALHPPPNAGPQKPDDRPLDPAQELLATIWSDVLDVPRVAPHDNFFDLGGHSLLATRAVSRIRSAFDREITLRDLFEAPTVAALAERLRRQDTRRSEPYRRPIVRVPEAQRPLSFAQQRLWFLDQLEGPTGALAGALYNMPGGLRLLGRLDTGVLQRCLTEILRRHEALRTVFPAEGGRPRQEVHPPSTAPLPVVDLGALADPEPVAADLAHREALLPFDLTRGPLARNTLLRVCDEHHVLLATQHHIVSDGWSTGVVLRELGALYDAFRSGRPSPLPELEVQYADFAYWQRQWLAGAALEQQLGYWKQQLAGTPELTTLPSDRPRPPVQTFHGRLIRFRLPGSLTERFSSLARRTGTTPFMGLHAAFSLLLSRYSGQDDVVTGTPVANRTRKVLEPLIGFFVNSLVLRTRAFSSTFSELLAATRQTTLAAYDHQDVPFEQIVEALDPARSLAHSPVFQVMFILQNVPRKALELAQLEIELFEIEYVTARFDLILSLEENSGGYTGWLEYATDLFDATTLRRLLSHFCHLLDEVASDSGQDLSRLAMLSRGERHQLRAEWNDTAADLSAGEEKRVHERVADRAATARDATAIVFGRRHRSYSRLDAHAGHWAAALRELGAGPETVVGICLPRGLDLVTALLAVLKSGAVYLPLDPAWPSDRIDFMLRNAGAPWLITTEESAPKTSTAVRLVPPLPLGGEGRGEGAAPLLYPGHPAYLLYTSGSTGQPKGVVMSHGVLSNLIEWQLSTTADPTRAHHRRARTLQFTSLSFDVSLQEIFSTWVSGGTLVLVDEPTRTDAVALAGLLVRERIERLFLPFVALAAVADAILTDDGLPETLGDVFTAGEQLRITPAVTELFRRLGTARLHNHYGPSESHACTAHRLKGDPRSWPLLPPIGRPITNCQVILAGASLGRVPAGVAGELLVALQMARGYHRRPAATAAGFIPDPFGGHPGRRLYRTGDRARWRGDGTLDFLGRLDHQVKIRGYRLEPGEVEALLARAPGVGKAAVVARTRRGVAALTAYVQGAAEVRDLRSSLERKLPKYMIPTTWMKVEEMPLTPSGKIDRRCLPEPDSEGGGPGLVAPRTPLEEALATLWCEVLDVDRVSIHDDFFQLGGHSLIATQLVFRICQRLDVDLPLRALFESPTVAGLARTLEGAHVRELLPAITPSPAKRYEPFPTTEVQQAYLLGRSSAFELGNVATQIYLELDARDGDLDLDRLNGAFNRLIERHDMLRAVFPTPGRQQVLAEVPRYEIVVENLRGRPAEDRRAHLAAVRESMSRQMLPADRWPLFEVRAHLLPDRKRIHFCLDGLISDAWGLRILVGELARFYYDPTCRLEPLAISFRDYMVAERALADSDVHRRDRDYWFDRLAGFPSAPDLPLAADPGSFSAPRFIAVSGGLEPRTWRRLRERAATAGLTPTGVLQAAFAEVLTAWSSQKRYVLNLTLFNRLPLHPDVNRLVGDFTSLTLLEIDHRRGGSFEERASALQQQLWRDLDHRYVGGVEVLRELARRRHGRRVLMPVVFTSTLGVDSRSADAVEAFGETVYATAQTPQIWLDHQVVEQAGALNLNWEVVEGLFPDGMIESMFDAYQEWLEQLTTSEAAWTGPMPCLTPSHQLELYTRANTTAAPVPEGRLHSPWLARVAERPDAVAVLDARQILTHGELHRRARRLGHRLLTLGARPDELVAIVMDKGWRQVVAALAIVLTGAAYLPVAARYPAERRRRLLEQGRVAMAVTEAGPDRKSGWPDGVVRVVIDDHIADRGPVPEWETVLGPRNLAYVIFTSGSTGTPKGVAIDHRGALNTVLDVNRRFGVTPRDRVLALSELSFDLSVYDVFGLLGAGGAIVVPDADLAREPGHWIELMRRHRVTVWNTVPALAQMLAEYASERSDPVPPDLGLVLLSGDWISPDLPGRLRAPAPEAQLVSLGGATEASIWSILHPIDDDIEATRSAVPYGKPMVNQSFHVLDSALRPCPVWVAGELYIGGVGLARCYWADPGKTALRFVPDPYTGGGRLYRTGDLGRYRPDGEIEILGRVDLQVKLGGHRIELTEIESTLTSHPDVRESAAVASGDPRGYKQLLAFVIGHGSAEYEYGFEPPLAEFLKERLPDYMVPAHFVTLDRLPLNANGKVDRGALARLAADKNPGATSRPRVAPRTPTELVVAGIWAAVLGLEDTAEQGTATRRLGIEENFFGLGGDSLAATRVITRVRDAFAVTLPLSDLFEAVTVAALAERIEAMRRQKRELETPPPRRAPHGAALPLSFAQQRLWVLDRLERIGTPHNLPTALCLRGRLCWKSLCRALEELTYRHQSLRTTFAESADGPIQVIHQRPLGATLRLDLTRIAEPAAEIGAIVEREALRPFDLGRGPLWRSFLLRLSDEEHVLLLDLHHIICDAWSLEILVRELSVLYDAFAEGRPSSFEAPELRYADYAWWQRHVLPGEVLEQQLAYWRSQLADLAVLDLPADRPRPAVHAYRPASRAAELPAQLVDALREAATREGASLFMVLLAAFKVLLQRYTGQDDVVVGSPVAGRNQSETAGVVGIFLNNLVLRTDLSGDPPFTRLLERVRSVVLMAQDHQDVPFERLLDALEIERDLSRTPLFQVFFNLLSFGLDDLMIGNMEIEPLPVPETSANFDLTLYVIDRSESCTVKTAYNAELFETATIDRLLEGYRHLLKGIAACPERRLASLPLLDEGDRARLEARLFERRREEEDPVRSDTSIPALLAEQAEHYADRPALERSATVVTYAELCRRAWRLARAVPPDEGAVALLFHHGPEMIAAMLGTLAAGKAYVPLDPLHPHRRLAHVVADSGVRTVLCDPTSRTLARQLGLKPIDRQNQAIEKSNAGSLAYLLYTSASTGRPKGVFQNQRNVLHHARAYANALGLDGTDRIAQLATYSFDAAVMDIFGALVSGATLCLYDVKQWGLHPLPAWLERHGVSVYHSTPTLYRQLVSELEARDEPLDARAVRWVVLGGEAVQSGDVEAFRRHFSASAGFVNGLGPTESTLALQSHLQHGHLQHGHLRDDSVPAKGPVSVGYPVEATEVLLLDRDGEKVGLYGCGEIVIVSAHLALGYWNRPALTAEAFRPDPQSPAKRRYHTGDLGRRLADGSVAFMGRRDLQVKIRGHRVELGEVESTLTRHPEVREAAVLARDDRGEQELVAYVVLGRAGRLQDLNSFLREELPAFMVPPAFVSLDALPVNEHGKLDRAALSRLEPDRGAILVGESTKSAVQRPSTPTEDIVATLWCQVLGLERLTREGFDTNFFELGGHSLTATQVVSRLCRTFGVEVALSELFRFPTVSALARRLDSLVHERGGDALAPIVPVDRTAELPLSFAQERLWFLDQLDKDTSSYHLHYGFLLRGRLDCSLLEGALRSVVRRHEILRTVFAEREGRGMQIVLPEGSVRLVDVDLRRLPQALERLAAGDVGRRFDLTRGPLLRTTLVALEENLHVLLITLHHIVADGWSIGVFIRELVAFYSNAPLPALPIQYGDFAHWQRHRLTGETLDRQIDYWRSKLEGLGDLLDLPTDRTRPAVQSFRGAGLPVRLGVDLVSRLQRLVRAGDATLFMTLLAGFQALLGRYARAHDVAVGSPIANRNRAELEPLIGMFVNTLVLRIDLTPRDRGPLTFAALLERVRQTTLEAYSHQDAPFEKVVEALQPSRQLATSPLFQVMFALQNVPMESLEIEGLSVTALESSGTVAKFDLSLALFETGGGLTGELVFNTDLFDATRIRRLEAHWRTLLAAAAEHPEIPIGALPILSAAERHQSVVEWNDTRTPSSPWVPVHRRFERQAEMTPDRVAVVFEDRRLTYRRLGENAGRLASEMTRHGVGRGDFVPVLLEQGPDVPVALLAVIKVGAACVPLDPRWPEARRERIFLDLRPKIVLNAAGALLVVGQALPADSARLEAGWQAQPALQERHGHGEWVVLRSGTPKGLNITAQGNHPGNPPEPAPIHPEDPIYAIYTSGSTGEPKASVNTHAGVANRLDWMDSHYGRDPDRVVLQTTHHTFDSSVWQLFWPLLHGGCCVIPPRRESYDLDEVVDLIDREKITFTDFVPSVFDVLVRTVERDIERRRQLATLHQLVLGGEAIRWRAVERFRRFFPKVGFTNLYGPTETAIGVIFHELQGGPTSVVPIGRPIVNTAALIIDSGQRAVAIGVAGEIHLGGVCVGLGYLHDPEKTARVFVDNPFKEIPGKKLYKTGDLGRFRADGNVDFLGRIDHQVKIRGFRVEPGEVEAALAAHPGVREAVVLVRGKDAHLTAYVQPKKPGGPATEELRSHVAQMLPDYMVPSAVVLLETFPVTAGGKIDRDALTRLNAPTSRGDNVATPQTPAEEIVTSVFADVLGLDPVGVHDHFFDLGGHSLLATQVISRLRRLFDAELPLRLLFEAPSAGALAKSIETFRRRRQGRTLPEIGRIELPGAPPLSFAQQRLWFLDRLGERAYNIAFTVEMEGRLDTAALERALAEIVRRHAVLRTRFPAADGVPVQVIEPAGDPRIPVVDLRRSPRGELRRLAAAESGRPYDLAEGPLVRLVLVRLGEHDHVLLANLHHIITDGWSTGVMTRELAALYEAFRGRRPSPLPELAVTYTDFAAWQRRWLDGEVLAGQLDYWRRQLDGAPALLRLPTDRPRPAKRTFRGARVPVTLSDSPALEALGRRRGATRFMSFDAVFAVLLALYSDQDHVLVGTPVANRHHEELEPLIGCFVNTLVVRHRLDEARTFLDLLDQVRRTALAAYEHQDVPFEQVLEAVSPERGLSHSPLFQVLLVLRNEPTRRLELRGLALRLLETDDTTAKFDLTLSLGNGEDGVLRHDRDLFDAATAERMAGHFRNLVSELAGAPEAPLTTVSCLAEAERWQLLYAWNRGEADDGDDLVRLFEDRAAAVTERPAVVEPSDDGSCVVVSFGELAGRARRLAGRLRALGVAPEVNVGLGAERSAGTIVALWAVLEAGGAYVPLDPASPKARLAEIAEDAGLRFLLIGDLLRYSASRQRRGRVRGDSPAYVLYTSGSLGRPKGVTIRRRSVVNLIRALDRHVYASLGEALRVTVNGALTFDTSVKQVFQLVAGHTLLLVPEAVRYDAVAFAGWLARRRVDVLDSTPTQLGLLLDAGLFAERAAAPKVVLVGGEAIDAGTWETLRGLSATWFYNVYGPTECTVDATIAATIPGPPVIGRPIQGGRTYVVDRRLRLAPTGVPGELVVGGAGLARGYVARTGQTAEAFVPDPFDLIAGQRLYRTGDRVRYRGQELEFLGRIDHQVKVRGFRVEPGEVEAVLERHLGVGEAVVALVDGTRLTAWYTGHLGGEAPRELLLREFLRRHLPEYMVPSHFIALERFPLTPNGKVDRAAVVRSTGVEPTPSRTGSMSTPTEEVLAAIWSELLGQGSVEAGDDFFELGGHSLLAVRAVQRIHDLLAVELPVRCLFETPILAELARTVDQVLETGTLEAPEVSDLEADAVLDEDIRPPSAGVENADDPSAVLLTGATGFLGAFLLEALMRRSQAKVHCLVRARDRNEGLARVRKALKDYGLWSDTFAGRIAVEPGDLGRPLLGLGEADFDRLAREIDAIYHNGARVHFVHPYPVLKAANVEGTRDVLRLACRHRAKSVHHMSTFSVFSRDDYGGREIDETVAAELHGGLRGGYSRTKWVAEQLVMAAQRRGLPASIYRFGRVSGASSSGAGNPDDFAARMVKGCIELGCVTRWDGQVRLTPVDYLAEAVVRLSFGPGRVGVHHVVAPNEVEWRDVLGVLRRAGHALEEVPYAAWRAALLQHAAGCPEHALAPLVSMFPPDSDRAGREEVDPPRFAGRSTREVLDASGLTCPKVDEDLIRRYLRYFFG